MVCCHYIGELRVLQRQKSDIRFFSYVIPNDGVKIKMVLFGFCTSKFRTYGQCNSTDGLKCISLSKTFEEKRTKNFCTNSLFLLVRIMAWSDLFIPLFAQHFSGCQHCESNREAIDRE